MKLQEYRDTFYVFSGRASDLNRQLGFAAIAIIWLFKKSAGDQPAIPVELFIPGTLVVSSLALDMAHYCVAAFIWRRFYVGKEKDNVSEVADIDHSDWLELPIWLCFLLKISCIIAAYILILIFLANNIGAR